MPLRLPDPPNNMATQEDLLRYLNQLVRDLNAALGEVDGELAVVNNRPKMATQTFTIGGNIDGGKSMVLADASASALILNLPRPLDTQGRTFWIKKTDPGANTVHVSAPNGGLSGDGPTLTVDLPSIKLFSDGNTYQLFDEGFTISAGTLSLSQLQNIDSYTVIGNTSATSATPMLVPVDDDGALSTNSALRLPTQRAVKQYVDDNSYVPTSATVTSSGITTYATSAEVLSPVAGKATTPDTLLLHKGMAKAWVNMDGINGAVSVRQAYNISGVSRIAYGTYTITLDRDMANSTYTVVTNGGNFAASASSWNLYCLTQPYGLSAGTFNVKTGVFSTGPVNYDFEILCAAVYGDLS